MRRFKPSPAMVVALIALAFSMAGTGVAARYVISSTTQIKNGAVTGADVKNSSLTGGDVRDGALTPADFSGSVQGPAGAPGPQGPQGAIGERGVQGEVGPTEGVVGGDDPVATPDIPSASNPRTVTTTHAGRLMVIVSAANIGVTCESGSGMVGVYLGGTAVPGTRQVAPTSAASGPRTLVGLTASLPAGQRSARLGYDCPASNPTVSLFSDITVGVTVLGD
jgi:hypothetical protein